MENSPLFNKIWRFNAIVIALTGIMAIILIALVAIFIFQEMNRSNHRNEVVALNPTTNIKEIFKLGELRNF